MVTFDRIKRPFSFGIFHRSGFGQNAHHEVTLAWFCFDWMTGIMFPWGLMVGLLTRNFKLGLFVSICVPFLAFLQGLVFFVNRKYRYGLFPHPVTPCHGVTIVHDVKDQGPSVEAIETALASKERPLRLLLIGDSLAVGIGQHKTTTPVMPEAIAKTISRRMGGRPVYWTCFGEDGKPSKYFLQKLKTKKRESSSDSFSSDDTTDSTSSSSVERDDTDSGHETENQWQIGLRLHSDLFDATYSLDCYDIAVIVSGANDLKSVLFPFLMERDECDPGGQAKKTETNGASYGAIGDLTEFIGARLGKARVAKDGELLEPPLIVLPEIPIRTNILALHYPSCYLGVPAFDLMASKKHTLAKSSTNVLSVGPGDENHISKFLSHKGREWEGKRRESIQFSAVQASPLMCRKVAKEMRKFFSVPGMPLSYQERLTLLGKAYYRYICGFADHHFRAFAPDGVHSNEVGSELWGRSIGEEICDAWEQRSSSGD